MSPADVIAIVSVIVSMATAILLVLMQRKDAEKAKWRTDMETRMSGAEFENHRLDVVMQNKAGRDDLERVAKNLYDEITGTRAALENKMDVLLQSMLRAIQGPR